MHRRWVAAGAVLMVIGAILLITMLSGAASRMAAPPLLSITAGLCLAAGAGLVGIGANRWYAVHRDRTTRT